MAEQMSKGQPVTSTKTEPVKTSVQISNSAEGSMPQAVTIPQTVLDALKSNVKTQTVYGQGNTKKAETVVISSSSSPQPSPEFVKIAPGPGRDFSILEAALKSPNKNIMVKKDAAKFANCDIPYKYRD